MIKWFLKQGERHAKETSSPFINAVNSGSEDKQYIQNKHDSYHLRLTPRTSIDIFNFFIC